MGSKGFCSRRASSERGKWGSYLWGLRLDFARARERAVDFSHGFLLFLVVGCLGGAL